MQKFILIREGCYLINLNLFLGAKEFNFCLLEFLGKYCKKRHYVNSKCDIYLLEFDSVYRDDAFLEEEFRDVISEDRLEIPFIYPYVDKALSFNKIYELYLYVYNSNCIYLYIKNNLFKYISRCKY